VRKATKVVQIENLVKMANAIGTFYASFSDREAGIAGVATHISRSWDPRMRRELIAYVENGGSDLLPIVAAATRKLSPSPK
jgi:formate dehydrogenase subunit delta